MESSYCPICGKQCGGKRSLTAHISACPKRTEETVTVLRLVFCDSFPRKTYRETVGSLVLPIITYER